MGGRGWGVGKGGGEGDGLGWGRKAGEGGEGVRQGILMGGRGGDDVVEGRRKRAGEQEKAEQGGWGHPSR